MFPSNVKVMTVVDTSYLDELLLDGDVLRPVAMDDLKEIPHDHLIQWCTKNAVYQLPTLELIDWLREEIADRSAIEVCAGKSGIGRALGIPSTDSYFQTLPEVRSYYELLQQPVVTPPAYVEKIDAESAVAKYKPEVVIGCFVTQRYEEGKTQDGNMFGPHESVFLENSTYIHVGNKKTHAKKWILSKPHEEYQFPWLQSRSFDVDLNVIWVWRND